MKIIIDIKEPDIKNGFVNIYLKYPKKMKKQGFVDYNSINMQHILVHMLKQQNIRDYRESLMMRKDK